MVGDDLGGGPALRGGLLLPDRHAEDVVDVPVRVDGGVEAGGAPGADVVVDDLGQRGAAGVDQDEAVLGGERGDVGEGGAEADAVGDLDEAADVVDGVEGGRRELAVPEAVGDGEDVRWHGPPRAFGRRPFATPALEALEWRPGSPCGAGAPAPAPGPGPGRRPPRRCRCRRVAPSALPSSMPFSNWFLAEPRLRASLGMAAPPKRSTTRTMATMSRSGPKMSASMMFSFTWVQRAVNWVPG